MNDFQSEISNLKFLMVCAAAGLFVVVLMSVFVWRWLRRKPMPKSDHDTANLTIDVSRLDASGPAPNGQRLEYYGIPVRLAVLIVAPLGRSHPLPDVSGFPNLIEGLSPGLMRIVESHQPIFRRWGPQLSAHGFVSSFFGNVALPGDKGKQTPWSSVVGKFEVAGQQFLAGLVCCAAAPNSLSQVVVQHVGQWHEVLRVK